MAWRSSSPSAWCVLGLENGSPGLRADGTHSYHIVMPYNAASQCVGMYYVVAVFVDGAPGVEVPLSSSGIDVDEPVAVFEAGA